MKLTLVLLALVASTTALNAVTITFAARGNARPVDASGNFLADGSLVRLGTFTAGFDFATNGLNLTALNAAFTQYGTTLTITEAAATPRVGSINGATSSNTGILGKQLFFWIFNAGTAETSSQWGIFTNPDSSWLAAGDEPPTDTTSISLGLTGIQPKVGTTNVISGITSGKLAAVPEPSTYALMGLGLVVVGFMARRRK